MSLGETLLASVFSQETVFFPTGGSLLCPHQGKEDKNVSSRAVPRDRL